MKKSVVEEKTGKVINVIEIDGGVWSPPEGCVLMEGGEIGHIWDGGKWLPPESPPEPSPEAPRDLGAEIAELRAKLAELEREIGRMNQGTARPETSQSPQ